MKKKVICITGLASHIPMQTDCDYIGIDRGAWTAMQQEIPLQCAIGDFDSITETEKAMLQAYCPMICLPAQKDDTDTQAAIQYAKAQGYQEILLFGGLGGRIDHTLANLQHLIYGDDVTAIINETHEIRKLKKGCHEIEKRFQYLSFFALEDSIMSEQGVKYPLEKRFIQPSDGYLVSNEIQSTKAVVTIHEGSVLMIQCNDTRSL